jgi:hypothetical protein
MRGDRRSIETGVTLDLSSLLMTRIRWLLASLMRAQRTVSMKKIAALQMLVNIIDPIIVSTTFGRRIAFHQSNTRRWFLLRNERQSLCVSLAKKVPFAFLVSVSYPGQVRLRAAGDRGSKKLLTTYSTVRLRCFEEPPKDPASRLGRD